MDNNLENRIRNIEDWQKSRIAQQITYPLDSKSEVILSKYFLSIVSQFSYIGTSGLEFPNLILNQNGINYTIAAVFPPLFTFTANVSTDFLSISSSISGSSGIGSYNNGDQIFVYSTDTLPNPLSSAISYFVVNATANGTQIQLSLTSGGSPINLTTVGVGTQIIQFFT